MKFLSSYIFIHKYNFFYELHIHFDYHKSIKISLPMKKSFCQTINISTIPIKYIWVCLN